ncbi:MAG: ABC transporter permease subunit [Bacteroidaceae bacterium]|nr:ABC transporter permease subunit [Bacteroidaceae bacterium]
MNRIRIMAAACVLLAGCAGSPEDNGSKKMLDGPDDLHGQVICVQTGSTPDIMCTKRYPDSEIKRVEQATDVIVMVSSGKVDAGTMSELVWKPLSVNYPELDYFQVPDCGTDIAMAFPKGKTGLADEFNAFLDTFLVSVDFREMYDGWMSDYDARPMPEVLPELCDSGVLTVAVSTDQPPYDMIRGDRVVGLEPELVVRFAMGKHMQVEFVPMNFQALIPYLVSDKADMACSVMSITEERSRMVQFSKPWIKEEIAVLFRKERMSQPERPEIASVNDMPGHSVAVMTGSVQDLYASEHFKGSRVLRVSSTSDATLAVESGTADAAMLSACQVPFITAAMPDLVCICDTMEPIPVGVAFNKERQDLRMRFNAFLDSLKNCGALAQMIDEWLQPGTTRPMPVYTDSECVNGTITVALSSMQEPICFVRDGQIVGIEVEMVTEFAHSMGMGIELTDMNFDAIIPYLSTNRADMAIALLAITEEREKSVDFSVSWCYERHALLVRKAAPVVADGGDAVKPGLWERIRTSFERNVILEQRYKLLWQGTLMTLMISLLSALFGTMLGVLLCMGTMSRRKVVSKPCDFYIGFMRCMPQVVLLMIMFYIVFGKSHVSGPAVAVVSFSMCFGAYCSVIFRSTLESIDRGQREAALAMGFTPARTFFNFILPQVMQRALPVYKNEFVSLVKATSIVGYIAVSDLTRAGDIIRSRTFEAFFPLIIVTVIYFLIIWLLTLLLRYAEFKSKPVVHKYSKKV